MLTYTYEMKTPNKIKIRLLVIQSNKTEKSYKLIKLKASDSYVHISNNKLWYWYIAVLLTINLI
jgi:hypothetical protein